MFKILFKFFDFAGGINKKKFHIAVVLGIVIAMCDAMKIPAIAVMISAIVSNSLTTRTIFTCTGIMLGSMVVNFFVRYTSTMLQTEAGYTACADKRIEIAEHLRYLPMGYFNNNSLGSITSVTTNTMESLGDIASRVVMMTTQGILNTVLVAAMILFYDWRIGIVVVLGLALYSVVNSMMQRRAAMLAPQKMRADTALVEGILEYIQGIAEVKAYNLTGAAAKKLVKAIDGNADINIRMEKQFIGYMTVQNFITKALGVAMSALSIALYIAGSMDLLIAIVMIISSFMIYAHLDSAGNYSALLRIIDASIDKAKAILDLQPMDTSGEDIAPKKCDIDV
ncbi:MAG: ABC transporter transmembrane domain-containing protein, partial [Treponema socranskii subsp. buccale]